MKRYRRKPIQAFRWDGKLNAHVRFVGGFIMGDKPCESCGELIENHGQLKNPLDSALSIFCKGYWIIVNDRGVTEYKSPEIFEQEYEEVK